ncbi:TonB-dependent receptor plug domain-containing protein [Hymenobacter sublimis]|uniref:TonB-dependent receptor plug domain-containing protein n=2 Tax=Hymenobacter sublimis TaxID=2933777 RepID=A0ABY4JEH3_9BACT|nr:TonB-dependent receptor plug domain-containing protein [Hymenobacter sublimis]UPL51235.1 TonB-dependent receptor plug domain-containing protein [Hymenobacter sublimis]
MSSNAQPLYVVDGMPVFQNTFRPGTSTSNGTIGFVATEMQELDANPLLSIPTEDIESVQVLKGAYETARYGSQAVNGVILITTRRGQLGKPRLTYAGYGGVQRTRYRYDLLDAREYAVLRNETAQRYGDPAPYSAADIAALGTGTDWQREVLRTAAVQEHHLGLAGGSSATRYYVATDYLSQQGVVLNSRLRRYATRAAVTQQLGQRLRLEASGSLAHLEQRLPNNGVTSATLLALPTTAPNMPTTSIFELNPARLAEGNYQTPTHRRLLAQLRAEYRLPIGFTLDVRAGLERNTLRSHSYQMAVSGIPAGENGNLAFTYRQLVLSSALRYAHSFGQLQQHVVAASVEAQRQDRLTTTEQQSYLPGTAPGVTLGGSSSSTEDQLNFYQLTTDYTFAGRYQVRGTLRRDASSSFVVQDRWQWLPGGQVIWHASQEKFLAGTGFHLKLWTGGGRTSARGLTGRNFTYQFIPINGTISQRITVLTPDHTTHLDAGLEAGLPNNRLTVTVEGYTRRTRHQGITPTNTTDLARLRNTGLELTVRSSWQAGRLQATSQLAAAFNRNRLETDASVFGYFFAYHRTYSGQPLSTFNGLRYLGPDATGQPAFQDGNGDGRGNFADQAPLGSGLPRQLLSLNQHFALGRFGVQLQADGMFGQQMLNTTLLSLDVPEGLYRNSSGRVRQRWTPTTPTAEVPAAGTYFQTLASTYTLQSGNHARLSAVTVSYKVWEKEARSASVWLGGHNLLVLTKYRGYDPNVSSAGADNQQAGLDAGAYPTARTLLLGLRATL